MPLPMGAMDEKLCRPPPPGTPATMEPSSLRYNELKNATGLDYSVIYTVLLNVTFTINIL